MCIGASAYSFQPCSSPSTPHLRTSVRPPLRPPAGTLRTAALRHHRPERTAVRRKKPRGDLRIPSHSCTSRPPASTSSPGLALLKTGWTVRRPRSEGSIPCLAGLAPAWNLGARTHLLRGALSGRETALKHDAQI